MASSLPASATADQIEEELLFQQTLLQSLEDADDSDPQKQAIQSAIDELDRRLTGLTSSDHASPSTVTTGDTTADDSDDAVELTGSRKRPARDTTALPPAKRIQKPELSTIERYRRFEKQARERREREVADAAYARQLSALQFADSTGPSSSSPSPASSASPTVSFHSGRPQTPAMHFTPYHQSRPGEVIRPSQAGRTDIVRTSNSRDIPSATRDTQMIVPNAGRPQPQTHFSPESAQQPPHSHEQHPSLDAMPKPSASQVKRESMPMPTSSRPIRSREVIDLTDDDDRAANRLGERARQILALSNPRGGSIPSPADVARARSAAAMLAMHQRGMTRDDPGSVYRVPGAFPPASSPSYAAPSPRMPSIYEPQSSRSQQSDPWARLNQSLWQYGSDLMHLMGKSSVPHTSRDPWDDEDGSLNDVDITEDLLNLLDNIRPDEEIPADEQDVEIPSMNVKLKPYQGTGLTWLQKMEDSSSAGSILADDMGLGKTVQAIALMSTRRSTSHNNRTNLIIAPVALLRQWKEEIATKLKRGPHSLSVFIHHSTAKKKTHAELRQYDVVITTFGTIASEMRKRDKFMARKEHDPQATERPDERTIFIGSQNSWYRVIIDEAQNIKNRNTQSARGSCHLNAKFRLCMTGTPMMNNVDELHSLIRFLRIKPYNDLNRFNNDFSRPIKNGGDDGRAAAMQRLQALLKAILLRRHKKSTINGKPILVLPERIVEETATEFSPEEQDFYKALETQSRTNFNRYVAAGTVGKSYAHILVMLLRLRQACCHPHLVKDFAVAAAADISEEDMTEFAKSLAPAVVERIKNANGEFECPVCYDAVENPAIFVPCGHDTCAECYVKIKDAAQSSEHGDANNRAKCPNCRGIIDPKQVIDFETFKKVHMPVIEEPEDELPLLGARPCSETETDSDATESESDDDTESESESETESLNGFVVSDDDSGSETESEEEAKEAPKGRGKGKSKAKIAPIFKSRSGGIQFDDSDDETKSEDEAEVEHEDESIEGPTKKKSKAKRPKIKTSRRSSTKSKSKRNRKGKRTEGKGKGKDKAGPEDKKKSASMSLAELKRLASRNKTAKKEYLRRLRRDFVPSAKVLRCMELLKQVMEDTDEKIIVFSQWTSLLDLLEVPINDEKWKYQRYDGSMSARDRADAIDDFKSPSKGVRMMLVSLKAGNAGLNLNCASQVIILDPFWNPYIEEQAIDRAHRLGQTREVNVHRLLVRETVEDRIMALQEQKRAMINEALDEGAGQRLSRLNQAQLGYLFGVRGALPPP